MVFKCLGFASQANFEWIVCDFNLLKLVFASYYF
jgi:hypothetical protein